MLTVPEAARRTGRNAETIRRWIREGRLRSQRVGTQYLIDEDALAEAVGEAELIPRVGGDESATGETLPNLLAALQRSRSGR